MNTIKKLPRTRKVPWTETLKAATEAEAKTRRKKPHTVGKTRFREDMIRLLNGL
jgi:hypothetical protein